MLQDVLHAHLERATSQAEQECQAILGAAGATRPPSATGAPGAEHASEAPRKQQRTDMPRTEQTSFTEQVRISFFCGLSGIHDSGVIHASSLAGHAMHLSNEVCQERQAIHDTSLSRGSSQQSQYVPTEQCNSWWFVMTGACPGGHTSLPR